MMQMLAENTWAKPGEFKYLLAKLSTAIKHDSWGSLEEASTEYNQIATKVVNFLAGKQSSNAKLEIEFMKKLVLCCRLRCKTLLERDALEDSTDLIISLKHIRQTYDLFVAFDEAGCCNLETAGKFPGNFVNKTHGQMIDLEQEIKRVSRRLFSTQGGSKNSNGGTEHHDLTLDAERLFDETSAELDSIYADTVSQKKRETDSYAPYNIEGDNSTEFRAAGGQLVNGSSLKRVPYEPGKTYLSITVLKVGQKDIGRREYVDPFVTCAVYDNKGNALCDEQYTGISKETQEKYIIFDKGATANSTFHLPVSIEELQKKEKAGIFFEFKHYKAKKKYNSTRCWTFFELDEIVNGEIRCEWYKKPIDVMRKRIRLHTVKDLFLHLDLKVREVE